MNQIVKKINEAISSDTFIFPMEGWRSPERQTGRRSGIHTAHMAGRRRQVPQEAGRRGVPPRNTAMTAVEGSRVL